MPTGIEGYNSLQEVIFSETSYAGNFMGSFLTNGQATGTYTDSNLIGRRLIYFVPQNSSDYGGPNIILNSSTGQMTWTYQMIIQGVTPPPVPSELVYYGGY